MQCVYHIVWKRGLYTVAMVFLSSIWGLARQMFVILLQHFILYSFEAQFKFSTSKRESCMKSIHKADQCVSSLKASKLCVSSRETVLQSSVYLGLSMGLVDLACSGRLQVHLQGVGQREALKEKFYFSCLEMKTIGYKSL